MENISVARLMLDKFGPENVPHLTGLSVHNQRIERLWRDVVTYIVQHYRDLFEFMESIGILDPLNKCELFTLHLVYQPQLDKASKDFIILKKSYTANRRSFNAYAHMDASCLL